MSDVFYRSLKDYHNALDQMYPKRNWPVCARVEPAPHVVESIKLYRRGFTIEKISDRVGKPKKVVKDVIRRSGCR